MIDFDDIILKKHWVGKAQGNPLLKEKESEMTVELVNLNDLTKVYKFDKKESHATSVRCEAVKLERRNQTIKKICDYLVMHYHDDAYFPILIELTSVKTSAYLEKKFEQLYCTRPLLEYYISIFKNTLSREALVHLPIYALLYESEEAGNFGDWQPMHLRSGIKLPRMVTPKEPLHDGTLVHGYDEGQREIDIASIRIVEEKTFDAEKLIAACQLQQSMKI